MKKYETENENLNSQEKMKSLISLKTLAPSSIQLVCEVESFKVLLSNQRLCFSYSSWSENVKLLVVGENSIK